MVSLAVRSASALPTPNATPGNIAFHLECKPCCYDSGDACERVDDASNSANRLFEDSSSPRQVRHYLRTDVSSHV